MEVRTAVSALLGVIAVIFLSACAPKTVVVKGAAAGPQAGFVDFRYKDAGEGWAGVEISKVPEQHPLGCVESTKNMAVLGMRCGTTLRISEPAGIHKYALLPNINFAGNPVRKILSVSVSPGKTTAVDISYVNYRRASGSSLATFELKTDVHPAK